MIEREFKDLVTSLELENLIKKEYNSLIKNIISAIENNISKNIKVEKINIFNEPITEEKQYDLNINVSLKNKQLPLQLLQFTIMNEIENCILLNLKNNLLFKDNDDFDYFIKRDYKNNLITFNLDSFKINIFIFFSKNSISNINALLESDSLFDYQINVEEEYFIYLNKEYQRFGNCIKILKSFVLENKDNVITNKMLKYILSYSLNKYNNKNAKEFDNSYIGFLSAFSKGLKDLLDNNIIVPTDEEYQKFKVFGMIKPNGRFNIISINNKSNNLLKDFDNSPIIKQFKDLRTKIIMSLPKDGNFVTINVTPSYVSKGKTIAWSFIIEGTEVSNGGGEYEYNEDNYYMCCYRAMLKGLQYVAKNKLGNNIIIKCNTLDPFKAGNLSYENESRFANILAFIKDNDMMIDYKICD